MRLLWLHTAFPFLMAGIVGCASSGGSATQSQSNDEYFRTIRYAIRENYVFPSKFMSRQLYITFTVKLDAEGNLLEHAVIRPSGEVEYDASVVAGVRKTEPFPKPPPPLVNKNITLKFRN